MWGWFIAVFAALWLIQLLLTKAQLKNYQNTLKNLSNKPSGFLGVGIQKRKLGVGAIVIVVTDKEGKVVESQVMEGVTVFSRFQECNKFNGMTLEEMRSALQHEPVDGSFEMAAERIEAQMNKTNLAV